MNALSDKFVDWWDAVADRLPRGGIARAVGIVVGIYLLITLMLGLYWSMSPGVFDVEERAAEIVAESIRSGGHS